MGYHGFKVHSVFLYGYAVVSVKVNTTDCDSVNMGSIPILLPNSCPGGVMVATLVLEASA